MFIRGDPKRSFSRKNFEGLKKNLVVGGIFFKRLRLSAAPKPECGITQPSSRIAFFYCFDLLELMALHDDILSSSSWAIGKSGQINQASNQSSKILTL